jgi:hypothetical protein
VNDSEQERRDRLFATLARGRARFLLKWVLIQVVCACVSVLVTEYLSLHRPLGLNGWIVTLLLAIIFSCLSGMWMWTSMQTNSRDYPS